MEISEQKRKILIDQFNEGLFELQRRFFIDLRKAGIYLPTNCYAEIERTYISIGMQATEQEKARGYKISFASDVNFYAKIETEFRQRDNEIGYGSSGSFSPKSNPQSTIKTLVAAELIKYWSDACKIVNRYCKKYSELEENTFKQAEKMN